jgi:hypothetical protein
VEQKLNLNDFPKVIEDSELMSLDTSRVDELREKIIIFGHQSVGMNIVEGLQKIGLQDKRFRLNIKFISEPSEINGPGFYHFLIGENHKPYSKIEHFKSFLKASGKVDIAFMKFCYVDIKDTTDVGELVNNYLFANDELVKEFPNTKFMHITCPYRTEEDAFNVNRNKYNILFRDKLGDKSESIFDLALIESTKQNGKRASFSYEGKIYYRMFLPFTKDSGHLNAYGSYLAAKKMLLRMISISQVR